MIKYRQILRLINQGISQRRTAISCHSSRNTVSKVVIRVKELNLSWDSCKDKSDADIENILFPGTEKKNNNYNNINQRKHPDLPLIHKQLAHQGVSLKLLWYEYCEECRLNKQTPLMYSRFCYHYQQYAKEHRASMHIPRKPGEQIEVDWAGNTGSIINRDTGESIPVFFFVGVLSYSQYTYVEAFTSRNLESWINAHINMFQFFGGVSRIIVPDNLKTGVSKPDWLTPVIQKSYQEMSEHYNTVIIPARVRKPKDKPNVEGAVGIISTWIIASLRQQKYFHLSDLNRCIREKLEMINNQPFQKKDGSRRSFFIESEKEILLPLPASPYELAGWKEGMVQFNYHVAFEENYYSVPFEYIQHKVHIRYTRNMLEIFYHDLRITSHKRLYGTKGQYSTIEGHMPKDHQQYLQWDAKRFLSWAEKIGPNTHMVIQSIIESQKVEQQGYRSCMALLKMSDKYSKLNLENACKKVMSFTPHPSFKTVKMILVSDTEKMKGKGRIKTNKETGAGAGAENDEEKELSLKRSKNSPFGFTRGAAYYSRRSN